MAKFKSLPTAINVTCDREHFLIAGGILDGDVPIEGGINELLSESNGLSESLADLLQKSPSLKTHNAGTLRKVANILLQAREYTSNSGVQFGTPGTKERLLKNMLNSSNHHVLGVAKTVQKKILGIIGAASASDLMGAINTVQKGKKRREKLTISNVLLLGKIQLQEYCMTELTNFSGTSTAAITGTASRLITLGYVKRVEDSDDGRKTFLKLTKQGQIFLDSIVKELTT